MPIFACLLALPALLFQDATVPETPQARRSAVESGLTPQPWVAGHTLDLHQRMQQLRVPGVSIAVLRDHQLDWAAAYGLRDTTRGEAVTTETLFQAASISKPVSAMAALGLVREGKLDLDRPVNEVLTSWELPGGPFPGEVTPRGLLSHTAGVGVHGFPGYATFQELPELLEVLDGAGAANTDAITRISAAGAGVQYSGGGSTVLQQLMLDVTGQPFDALLEVRVLAPLGMQHSTYQQPLDATMRPDHSAGHGEDGLVLPGRFRVHPEQFAAGLWTTPGDLARFMLELQRSLRGDQDGLLTPELADAMVTSLDGGGTGLGLFALEFDGRRWFEHGGSNMGFKALMRGSVEGGDGVIVMTNGESGYGLANEIVRGVARVYGWSGMVEAPLAADSAPADPALYTGRFERGPDQLLLVTSDEHGLWLQAPPLPPQSLAPLGEHVFLLQGSPVRVRFTLDAGGAAASAAIEQGRGRPVQEFARMDEGQHWPIEDLFAGQVEAAVAFYRELHATVPDDPMLEVGRLEGSAVGLWNQGHRDAGLAMARLAVELYPGEFGLWETLGKLELAGGNRAEALQAYLTCLERLESAPMDEGERRMWSSMIGPLVDWLAAR